MSFNRLPTEIKRLIFKMCYQADQAYGRRLEARGGGSEDSDYTVWNGRSCSALSMVNKDTRAMTVEYVFKIIKVSQMDAKVFSMSILDSPICSNFTTVDFNVSDPEQLSFAVFHVLPRLPSLNAIWGINENVTEALFGKGGMDRVSKLKYLSTSNEGNILAWRKFKSIATCIDEWKIELKEKEVEALFSIDPAIKSKIRSLSLQTPEYEGFPILESQSSQFPALLDSLPSLLSLTVTKASELASNQDYPNPLSETFLSTEFQFLSTLTSFTWIGHRDYSTVDLALFRFLARVESLQHLRIETSGFQLPEASNQVLPTLSRLKSLELLGGDELDTSNTLDASLDFVLLPKLESLTLGHHSSIHDREDLYNLETELAEKLYWRIFRFKETLRDFYLVETSGIYRISLDHIRTGSFYGCKCEPPYNFHTDGRPGNAEVIASDFFGIQSTRRKIRDDEILDGIVAGVNELKLWVGEEIDGAQRLGDIPKAKQLWNAMKPIWELREWSRD
ncbi:hypothetical protein JCM5350_008002 [Sporobolomyces pararoseus]